MVTIAFTTRDLHPIDSAHAGRTEKTPLHIDEEEFKEKQMRINPPHLPDNYSAGFSTFKSLQSVTIHGCRVS
jgi:hypothetical protein